MGLYQVVFGVNWAYHLCFDPGLLDVSSFISGMLGIAFFMDYLVFRRFQRSMFSFACITVDDGIREAEEGVAEVMDAARDMLGTCPRPDLQVAVDPCEARSPRSRTGAAPAADLLGRPRMTGHIS